MHLQVLNNPSCLGTNVPHSIITQGKPEWEWFTSGSPFPSDDLHYSVHAPSGVVRLISVECEEKRLGFLLGFLIILDFFLREVGVEDAVGTKASRLDDLLGEMRGESDGLHVQDCAY